MMKRLIQILFILCLFYILVQLGFKYFGNGHTVNYEIKGNDYTVKIKEVATFNTKKENNNYYFTFNINGTEFYFQTYQTFQKNDHVIKNVKYFKNDHYECIYPIFKNNEQVTDILCQSDDIIYHYHDLIGRSGELDKFARDLRAEGYNENAFIDDIGTTTEDNNGPITVYHKNLVKHHYIGVDNYSGIYLVNNYFKDKFLYKITLFPDDAYEKTIESRAERYYIVANYNSKHDFNTFYLVDLVYNDQKTIKYHSNISFDSYIQGVVGNEVYLFDRDSKKQYKIEVKAGTIVEIGNEQTGIRYYNLGKWEKRKATEAFNTNLYFNEYPSKVEVGYEKIDKIGNKLSGHYYYYKKVGNNYEVFRSNIQDKKLTYLFTTSNIDEIKYLKDYIYYKEGNKIKYYHDMTGVRTIIIDSEFEFNKTLKYHIYYSNK